MDLIKAVEISVPITRSSKESEIIQALKTILKGEHGFYYFQPIFGLSYSVRMFSNFYLTSDAVMFPKGEIRIPENLAKDLFMISANDARYKPNSDPIKKKGWEIRELSIKNGPVAIALAVWV